MDPPPTLYEFGHATSILQESFSMKFSFPGFTLHELYTDVEGCEKLCRRITFSDQFSSPRVIGQNIHFPCSWYVSIRCSDNHARVALKFHDYFRDASARVLGFDNIVAILKFRIHIIDKDGDVLFTRQWQSWEAPRKIRLTEDYAMPDFISLVELFDNQSFLMPNKHLWVRCEGTLYGSLLNLPVSFGKQLTLPKLFRADFLADEDCSDIQIVSQTGKYFKAHKIILSHASLALKSLVLSTAACCEEPSKLPSLHLAEGEIEVAMLLEYIYTGNITQHDWSDYQQAEKLIVAAKNYDLIGLQWLCFQNLVTTITLSSFPEIVKLFQRNKAGLSVRAILNRFCVRNQSKLVQLESFKKFATEEKDAFLYVTLLAGNRDRFL